MAKLSKVFGKRISYKKNESARIRLELVNPRYTNTIISQSINPIIIFSRSIKSIGKLYLKSDNINNNFDQFYIHFVEWQ